MIIDYCLQALESLYTYSGLHPSSKADWQVPFSVAAGLLRKCWVLMFVCFFVLASSLIVAGRKEELVVIFEGDDKRWGRPSVTTSFCCCCCCCCSCIVGCIVVYFFLFLRFVAVCVQLIDW